LIFVLNINLACFGFKYQNPNYLKKKEEKKFKEKKHTHFFEIYMVKKHEIMSYMRPNYCIYHNYNLQDLYLTVTLFNLFTKVLKAP
jgi:hypothetical protein